MSTRSDQLGDGLVVGGGSVGSLFTVPAGATWLLKRICFYAPVSAADVYVLYEPVGGPGSFVVYKSALAFGEGDDHETWWACQPTSEIVIYNGGADPITAFAFGAKLLGSAD